VTVGQWSDGRLGVLHALRTGPLGTLPHQVIAFGDRGSAAQELDDGQIQYGRHLEKILEFCRTGIPPVPMEESVEEFAFLAAAELSKQRGGVPVRLSEVD
jgi:hypothetical protein